MSGCSASSSPSLIPFAVQTGAKAPGFSPTAPEFTAETDSPLEGDGFELPVREHRATAPSHGFAAASHREARLRGAPASHGETAFRGAAGLLMPAAAIWSSSAVQAALSGREARRHVVRSLRNPARRKRD